LRSPASSPSIAAPLPPIQDLHAKLHESLNVEATTTKMLGASQKRVQQLEEEATRKELTQGLDALGPYYGIHYGEGGKKGSAGGDDNYDVCERMLRRAPHFGGSGDDGSEDGTPLQPWQQQQLGRATGGAVGVVGVVNQSLHCDCPKMMASRPALCIDTEAPVVNANTSSIASVRGVAGTCTEQCCHRSWVQDKTVFMFLSCRKNRDKWPRIRRMMEGRRCVHSGWGVGSCVCMSVCDAVPSSKVVGIEHQ
jgi:hypothetical protein